ncbi:protein eiger isoform X2 [Nylanderia fulva]|uniref:protein eiger isoform X2 n=1 Tax=Nylanderia fulva TaxID=613905 RepID=UPI0010FB00A0|nr:protein eiger isoform X2 [Nylanderia fulva]
MRIVTARVSKSCVNALEMLIISDKDQKKAVDDELCPRHSTVLSKYKDAFGHVNPRVEFTKLDDSAIILPNRPTAAMTSMLTEENSNKAAKMKQRLMSNGHVVKEDTRSFLNFSRENLSVSHSDLEQGFNRSRQRPSRKMILSMSALMISILCLGLVSWKLNSNAREIEQLRRDVDSLKRFLKLDLINEIKTLKELYEESSEDNDPGEADIDNADYDSNYDDDGSASHDYPDNSRTLLTYDSRSSGFLKTATSLPTSTEPDYSHKAITENKRENYKNIERDHDEEEHTTPLNVEKINDENSAEHKRDARTGYIREGVKLKRSVRDHTLTDDSLMDTSNYRAGRYPTKKTIQRASKTRPYTSDESHMNNNTEIITLLQQTSSISHSPKKYHTHARLETFPLHDQLNEAITRPNSHSGPNTSSETASGEEEGRDNWRNRDVEIHKSVQVYAIHYGADSALFTAEDEHTGNGRARHSNGVFKAWRPSDWATNLEMNRYFTLANDGKITVHEPGLYLAYAQIHYLDEHDENGFRLLVNGRSILQCMVYSPGRGHKSRSCFSAQMTILHEGDHLVLKDIGSARYTLFQHDKSFFGLVKLGELRQQQQNRSINRNN